MRRLLSVLTALLSATAVIYAVAWLLLDARSRLPDHWNPLTPLDVAAPVTPFRAEIQDRLLREIDVPVVPSRKVSMVKRRFRP